MSKRNKVLLGGGIGVLVVVLIMVSASAKREKGVEVRFETVGRRDLVAAVTASGKIQPKKKVDISADITGRITRLAVEEGEVAVPGTFSRETGLLLTVSDLSVIQTTVQVDETDVVRVQLGDSVEVTIDAFPDTTFVGRVTKVSNSAILNAASAAA